MRALMVVMAIGCGDAPMAGVDGGPPPPSSNLRVPVGSVCGADDTPFCGAGVLGACVGGVCRAQCSAVDYPRCLPDFTVSTVRIDGRDVCVCVPE